MTTIMINVSIEGTTWHRVWNAQRLDYFLAALSIDPQTPDEWILGNDRFGAPPRWFELEQWTLGLQPPAEACGWLLIDLTARVVFIDPRIEGWLKGHANLDPDDNDSMRLPYTLPDHWLVNRDLTSWRVLAADRRRYWSAQPNLHRRRVLYEQVTEYFVEQLLFWLPQGEYRDGWWTAPADWHWEQLETRANPKTFPRIQLDDFVAEIHARWLMLPHPDLDGQTPRACLELHRNWIGRDLWDREYQWSQCGECPPPLPTHVSAYRWAGLGQHEGVLYYDLLRDLLRFTAAEILLRPRVSDQELVAQVNDRRETWLDSHPEDLMGRATAADMIEQERRRIPWVVSGEDAMSDCSCPICRAMGEVDAPMFCHIDESHFDDEPVFRLDPGFGHDPSDPLDAVLFKASGSAGTGAELSGWPDPTLKPHGK